MVVVFDTGNGDDLAGFGHLEGENLLESCEEMILRSELIDG